jgi:hypothetical protein
MKSQEKGIYVRRRVIENEDKMKTFNEELISYEDERFDIYSFDKWSDERKMQVKYGASYFLLPRDEECGLVATNDFRLLDTRFTQMNDWSKQLQQNAYAPQWRYDKLQSLTVKYRGKIDMKLACSITSFLSPDHVPDYPHHNAKNEINGFLAVFNVDTLEYRIKHGNWNSEWISYVL